MATPGHLKMDTPPLYRRNPFVAVRRVQSERKHLTTFPPRNLVSLYHKHRYDHMPRTAIIPPPQGRPRMVGTSQGYLKRGRTRTRFPVTRSRSEAHLQPLFFVTPPYYMGPPHMQRDPLASPYRQPLSEEETLAQERLAAFLADTAIPHPPSSIGSDSESHVYESLISRDSNISGDENNAFDDDVLSYNDKTQNHDVKVEQPSTKFPYSSKSRCLSDPQDLNELSPKYPISSTPKKNSGHSITSNKMTSYVSNDRVPVESHGIKPLQEYKLNSALVLNRINELNISSNSSWNSNFSKVTPLDDKLEISNSFLYNKDTVNYCKETDTIREPCPTSPKNGSVNNSTKKNSIKYLRSLFKKRKKQKPVDISTIQTNVSVIHINKENGVDEVSFRESTCYRCEGNTLPTEPTEAKLKNRNCSLFEVFSGTGKPNNHRYLKHKRKSCEIPLHKLNHFTPISCSKSSSCLCPQQSTESSVIEPSNSVPKIQTELSYGKDKGVQVSSEDILRSHQVNEEKSPSESDLQTGEKTGKESAPTANQVVNNNSLKNSNKTNMHSIKNKVKAASFSGNLSEIGADNKHDLENDEKVVTLDFDSESSSEEEEGESSNSASSPYAIELYPLKICRTPFIYIYQARPAFSKSKIETNNKKSKLRHYKFSKDASTNIYPYKGGFGSSGLGSSGSEEVSSIEEDEHRSKRGARPVTVNSGDISSPNSSISSSSAEEGKPSNVTFLEPCFRSALGFGFATGSSSTTACVTSSGSGLKLSSLSRRSKVKKNRLPFDYSWSWDHLDDLVQQGLQSATSVTDE